MTTQVLRKFSLGSLYGFVFLLPWQTLYFLREVSIDGEKWEYGTIAIYLSDLFLVFFLFSYLGLVVWNWYRATRLGSGVAVLNGHGTILLTLVMLLVVFFGGALWSSDPLLSTYRAVQFSLGALLVLVLWVDSWRMRLIVTLFILSILGQAFLGLFQFFWQGDFASTLLGISKHVVSSGGVSVVESEMGDGHGRFLRAYGGFSHPNIFGVLCALCVILSLASAYVWRMFTYFRLFFVSASMVLFAGLVVSFSRSGLIVFFCGLMFLFGYFLLHNVGETRVDRRFLWRLLGSSLVSYGLIVLIFFLAYGELFITRAQGDARLEQLSLTERTNQFQEAFVRISEQPLLGSGLGVYTKDLMIADDFAKPVWQYQAVHNSYVLALSEVGFVGFSVLIFLSGVLFWRLYRNRLILREDFFAYILIGIFTLYLISAIFDHWQWGSHFGVLFGALLLGLSLSHLRHARQKI